MLYFAERRWPVWHVQWCCHAVFVQWFFRFMLTYTGSAAVRKSSSIRSFIVYVLCSLCTRVGLLGVSFMFF